MAIQRLGASLIRYKDKILSSVLDKLSLKNLSSYSSIQELLSANNGDAKIDQSYTIVADYQGIKLSPGTTLHSSSWFNKLKCKALQTCLRLSGGAYYRFKGISIEGNATSDDTQTSEGISTRMARVAEGERVTDIHVEDYKATGLTTGIHLIGVDRAVLRNINFEGNVYSPVGLNSAGGYGLLTSDASMISVDGLYHKLRKGKDRHAAYISDWDDNGTIRGNKGVVLNNVVCDWTENTRDNGIFAMNPIHLRTVEDVLISNVLIFGRTGGGIVINKQRGVANNVSLVNINIRDSESYQNGNLMKTGAIDSYAPWANRGKKFNLTNANLSIIRGVDTTGNKMPAGSDSGVLLQNFDGVAITASNFKQETGPAVELINCTDVFIDGITDEQTDTTYGGNAIVLTNVTGGVIGSVRTNRKFAGGKERLYTLTNCTDIEVRTSRYVKFRLQNGTVTGIEDPWSMLSGTPVIGSTNTDIEFMSHVTAKAVKSSFVEVQTGSKFLPIKVAFTSSYKGIRVQLLNTATGVIWEPSQADVFLAVHFNC